MKNDLQIFRLTSDSSSERVDVYLTRVMENASRSYVQKLITDGFVCVNEKTVKANYKVQTGDEVTVAVPEAKPAEIVPEALPLDIVYEDDDIIVVNKSRGMVVHPAAGNYSGTLVNALMEHCDNLSGINGVIRPGIVHRLDKETSGVMVAAKNDQAHISLAEQIKNRTASRQYMAIVHGNIVEEEGVINAPIGRHPNDRQKMAVTFHCSKEAVTNFTVMERLGNYTLVKCKLLTGRTHQIRVHMAYIKHPVVGDPKYGPQKGHFAIQGQALHAYKLSLLHPVSGRLMTFTAPLPQDMEEILSLLRNNGKRGG